MRCSFNTPRLVFLVQSPPSTKLASSTKCARIAAARSRSVLLVPRSSCCRVSLQYVAASRGFRRNSSFVFGSNTGGGACCSCFESTLLSFLNPGGESWEEESCEGDASAVPLVAVSVFFFSESVVNSSAVSPKDAPPASLAFVAAAA